MNSLFKRIFSLVFSLFLGALNSVPRFKLLCVWLTKKTGVYHFLSWLYNRPQPKEKEAVILSYYEQQVFNSLSCSSSSTNAEYSTKIPKKRLAYISPLPPLRSGISDYSADLLVFLAEFYEIDIIVEQDRVDNNWINEHCIIRSAEWFSANSECFDRVIYHFGNSAFHEYMLALLARIPGIVVLHDFFLGHLVRKHFEHDFPGFVNYLYTCHGYSAVTAQLLSDTAIWKFPVNYGILTSALNVIVHSSSNQQLAKELYGSNVTNDWAVIPLLRPSPKKSNKLDSRIFLNLPSDAFVTCSFGLTGPIKLSHRLIDAWLASDLALDTRCFLIFVGDNDQGEYGESLIKRISDSGLKDRILITGWVDTAHYQYYLSAADVGVQLRTLSRGETSAAVLDCMNYGLATLVNANGTMADLSPAAVHLIADDFSDTELVSALELLFENSTLRHSLATNAAHILSRQHNPKACAGQYFSAIESSYSLANVELKPLIKDLAHLVDFDGSERDLMLLTQTVLRNRPTAVKQKLFLVDVSALAVLDLKTGIQRVVRAQLEVLFMSPPKGYRVEPVFLTDTGNRWHYRFARDWTKQFLELPANYFSTGDVPVAFSSGDILFCADLNGGGVVAADKASLYSQLMSSGVKVFFQVFDLLPISNPDWFPAEISPTHHAWAEVAAKSSGAICISLSVANEFKSWCDVNPNISYAPPIGFFHLGADISTSKPSMGLPSNADTILSKLSLSPSFLMVGTLEPRKGHLFSLDAFDSLWQEGSDVNLVIIGKAGWHVDVLAERINNHPNFNVHLFWLASASDEFLTQLYASCDCLIAASEAEGFGLPLIEAAQHGMPIIARDIAVFREVAGDFASYFENTTPSALTHAIKQWIELQEKGESLSSEEMPWLTWQQSTEKLLLEMGISY